MMDANGDNPVRLTQSDGEDWVSAWSPDGTKIAFRSNRDGDHEIYVMNADGTNPVRLTQIAGYDESPAWSPDGTKIVFTSSRDGNQRIYVLPYGPAAPIPDIPDHGNTERGDRRSYPSRRTERIGGAGDWRALAGRTGRFGGAVCVPSGVPPP